MWSVGRRNVSAHAANRALVPISGLTSAARCHHCGMGKRGAVPVEGGVKVVFDVPTPLVDAALVAVSGAGFAVDSYYRPGLPQTGRPPDGFVRLGADRRRVTYKRAEEVAAAAAVEAAMQGLACNLVGVDTWKAR